MALSGSDLEWLFGELAHAARRGKPLAPFLAELARAEEGTSRGRAAARLAQHLAEGRPLSAAVAADARRYPPGSDAAIEAGERSGRLPEALTAMAETAQIEGELKHRISYVLIYPIAVASACSVIMIGMMGYVLPTFQHMFDELNLELPILTQILPTVVLVTAVVGIFIPACLCALLFLLSLPWTPGRRALDYLRFHTPVLNRPVRYTLLSRWCSTAGVLFAAGAPEAGVVWLAGQSTGNATVQQLSERMALRLEAGAPLSQAMLSESFFPPVLSWMVEMSSSAGGHVGVWPMVHSLYRDHARIGAAFFAMALGIFFLCVVGALAALSVLALFLPLIKITTLLGG